LRADWSEAIPANASFSCYQRRALLGTAQARDVFENVLERFRQRYRFYIAGYVVMPEHVHLLITEPELGTLAAALMQLSEPWLTNC